MMHGVSCQAANWRASQRWKCTIAESGWSTEPKVLATRVPQIPQLLCKNMQNGLSNLQHSNLVKTPRSALSIRWSSALIYSRFYCVKCLLRLPAWMKHVVQSMRHGKANGLVEGNVYIIYHLPKIMDVPECSHQSIEVSCLDPLTRLQIQRKMHHAWCCRRWPLRHNTKACACPLGIEGFAMEKRPIYC